MSKKSNSVEYAGVARIDARFVRMGVEEVIKEESEIFEPALFTTKPAIVTRGYGLTLNLGNYESARFDVSVSMPCYAEDLDACDTWCRAWAEERVQEEATSVRGDKKPKKLPGAF